ncbi:MAG: ParB N-terminal domain-containing protein, partial [Oscillospiraceae bacterium]|nr:ParB N-terminal domain-containing protein [Oscillospiraceae bacterium]
MKMEKVFDVYVSTDYDSFKVLDGNRDPEKNSRIKKIERSIDKVGFIEAPILVNEHYEVIDGQARLAVAKKHGYPIYFCILPGKGIEECIALNQSSTAWTIMDYIHSYAAQGNENYI